MELINLLKKPENCEEVYSREFEICDYHLIIGGVPRDGLNVECKIRDEHGTKKIPIAIGRDLHGYFIKYMDRYLYQLNDFGMVRIHDERSDTYAVRFIRPLSRIIYSGKIIVYFTSEDLCAICYEPDEKQLWLDENHVDYVHFGSPNTVHNFFRCETEEEVTGQEFETDGSYEIANVETSPYSETKTVIISDASYIIVRVLTRDGRLESHLTTLDNTFSFISKN